MIKKILRLKDFLYSFYMTYEIFYASLPKKTSNSIEDLSKSFIIDQDSTTLDLGCGRVQRNPFKSNNIHGLDLFDDVINNIHKCSLGFEAIPFPDKTFTLYFSDKKFGLSEDYGINTSYKIIDQYINHRHLIAFLSK